VCSSNYFFKVSCGNASRDDVTQALAGRKDDVVSKLTSSTGDLQVKTRDGTAFKAGSVLGTVLALKQQIRELLGIKESQQRLFHRDEQGQEQALDEDWRTLGCSGVKREDTVLVVVREPWQRTDAASKTVHMTVPEPCLGAFEHVLEHLYGHYNDPRGANALPVGLSAEEVLGAVWLAGHLEMRRLQLQLARRLKLAVGAETAVEYIGPAVRLGLGRVAGAAMRVAAAAVDLWRPGAWNGLPVEAMERLLGMVDGGSVRAVRGRDRAVAAYLRARDGEGRLDRECYERVMGRHSRGEGAGEEAGVDAEDVVLLLGYALRFGDAGLEGRCVRGAAAGFSRVRVEDLAGLPVRVVVGLLSEDRLGVESEDEVYRAVGAYVAGREGVGCGLTGEERRGLWGCCR
jgi:hypothetical protein